MSSRQPALPDPPQPDLEEEDAVSANAEGDEFMEEPEEQEDDGYCQWDSPCYY